MSHEAMRSSNSAAGGHGATPGVPPTILSGLRTRKCHDQRTMTSASLLADAAA
jgi:hypothetical protein